MGGIIILAHMNPALVHGLLALIGLLVIVEGLGLALVPKALGFLRQFPAARAKLTATR